MPPKIPAIDLSTTHLYPRVLRLLELWIDAMEETLGNKTTRTASDFANARQFFKDNNVLVDKPLPSVAPKVVTDGILESATVDVDEDTPSFLRCSVDKQLGPMVPDDKQ